MSQNIRLRRSAVPSNIPGVNQLQLGELAINTHDGKLFLKQSINGNETVVTVGETSSIATSASYALSSSYSKTSTSSSYAVSASYALSTPSAVSSSYAISSSYALSGSYASNASDAISASYAQTSSFATDFTVAGTLTAQKIVVQVITSSTEFVTGSTRFGSQLTDTHQFTGSVSVTGSLQVNGSSVIRSNQTSSMSVLSASYANNATTASYALDSNLLDGLDSTVFIQTGSFNSFTSSYNIASGSFSTRVTSLEQFSSSLDNTFATDAELNAATASLSGSIALLSGSYLNSSASFNTRILNNSASIAQLSGSFLVVSSSNSTRITALEQFSSSLDATYATDAELNAATASLSASIALLSGSVLTNSASFAIFSGSYINESASFASRITTNSASISSLSASFNVFSGSFMTGSFTGSFTGSLFGTSSYALTSSYANNFTVAGTLTAQTIIAQTITSSTEYVTGSTQFGSLLSNTHQFTGSVSITGSLSINGENLTGVSSSFASRITTNSASFATFSGSYVNESSSFASRITTNSASFATFSGSYVNESSSFANRITTNSASFATFSGSYINESSSFASRITTNSASFATFSGSYINESSSFASRITTNSASFATFSGSYINESASFASRSTTNSASIASLSSSFSTFSGSFMTGSFTGSFTGSVLGTASYANQALSASYWSGSITNAATASYVQLAQTASYVLNAVSSSYATNALNAQTASYANNFTVGGTLTAQTLVVQTITSSVEYVSGSTQFGSTTANTHQFTGSVLISGSLQVNGSNAILSNQTSSMSVATASYALQAVSASFATLAQTANTASYVITAQTASYVQTAQTASYVLQAVSASYASQALTASYWSGSVLNATSASYANNATTSSYALTASYALNAGGGGISAIYIADNNIIQGTASYFNFSGSGVEATVLNNTASIIINGGGGGGATGNAITFHQSALATTWSFTHDLSTYTPLIEVYDESYNVIIPTNIQNTSISSSVILFDVAEKGYAVFSVGGNLQITGSNAKLVQTVAATTWSFYHGLNETYPVFTIFDSNDNVIVPQGIHADNAMTASIYFSSARTGTAVAANCGLSGSSFESSSYARYALSASYAANSTTASYALTASYANNIVISGSINNADYIDFNTGSATPAWKSGRVFWDNVDGCLAVYNAEADVTLNVGQENWTRVYNNSGVNITNGTPVRLTGTHGDVPEVTRAISLAVSGAANLVNQILGLATHTIEVGTFGYITTQGLVRGLNTSAYNDGDTLYVETGSAGLLRNTVPPAPYEIIPVGQVVKASPGGSGIIYVAVQQPLDFTDLSSVIVDGVYTQGDIWTYIGSGSSGYWNHTSQLSGSYGITGSIRVTNGITGSLFGTSSYASQALTSSYAVTAVTSSYPLTTSGNSLYSPLTGSYANLGTSDRSTVIGYRAATNADYFFEDTIIGYRAGENKIESPYTALIGDYAGQNASGSDGMQAIGWVAGGGANFARYSTFVGPEAGSNTTKLEYTVAIGTSAGAYAQYAYDTNMIGYIAGGNSRHSQYSNFIGRLTGYSSISASYSNFIGNNVGYGSTLGRNNIIIGTGLTLPTGTQDSINIGALIFGTGSYFAENGVISGSTNGKIGINQPTPLYSLDVSGSGNYTNGLTVTGSLLLSGSVFINQASSSLASGAKTISSNATSSFTSAFYNYTLVSGSNARSGHFITVWNGGSIEFTDVSTNDIGSTSGVALTASLSGANVLLTTVLPSSGWTIKTLVNLL